MVEIGGKKGYDVRELIRTCVLFIMIDLNQLLTDEGFLKAIVIILLLLLLANGGVFKRLTGISFDWEKGKFNASVKADREKNEENGDDPPLPSSTG